MTYNDGKMLGVGIGIIAGLIISVFVLKAMNKDGKIKTEYDEMQKLIRGKAYMYGFWTVIACEALLCFLTSGSFSLPFDGFTLHFTVILAGVLVQVTYCIWNDAYIGLNNSIGRFAACSIIISLINFALAGYSIAEGTMIKDGVVQSTSINLLVAILFIVIGLEMLLKKITDNGQKED